jgi:hypothetical protein
LLGNLSINDIDYKVEKCSKALFNFVDNIVNAMLKYTKSPDAIGEVINVGSG